MQVWVGDAFEGLDPRHFEDNSPADTSVKPPCRGTVFGWERSAYIEDRRFDLQK
jgi:hypothetical protein